MTAPIRLLFVAGAGRSGTTILNTILGQVPGMVAVGEVRYIWERAFGENHRCGCGEPFARCPFWSDVIDRAFGPAGPPAPGPVSADLLARLRILRVPAMLARSAVGRSAVPEHPHDAAIAAIYQALADTPGVEVIVDSSKLPPYASPGLSSVSSMSCGILARMPGPGAGSSAPMTATMERRWSGLRCGAVPWSGQRGTPCLACGGRQVHEA